MVLTGNPLTHSFPATGEYDVQLQVRDRWNRPSTVSQTILVVVEPVPVPDFTWGSAQAGSATVFANATVVDPALEPTYLWDFGDGGTSTDANPSHVFAAAGTYDVTLTVEDQYERGDSVTLEVEVSAPAEIWAELEAGEADVLPFVWDRRYGITESAGLISAWADPRPGRGATLTASGSSRATMAGGVPTFDGVDDKMVVSLPSSFTAHVASGLYLMAVVRVDSGSHASARVITLNSNQIFLASDGTSLRATAYDSSAGTGVNAYTASNRLQAAAYPKLVHGIFRASPIRSEARVENGIDSTWGTATGVGSNLPAFGAIEVGGTVWYFKGAVYQILIMKRPPTSSELTSIKAAAARDHGANLTWT